MNTYEKIDKDGNLSQVQPYQDHEVLAVSKTFTAADSDKVYHIATDALVMTLPSTANNLTYTFVNSGADGNNIITISPAAADGIYGSIALAASVFSASGTDNKDLINTKATANKGDWITVKGDGLGGWYITGGIGIWASEA